MNRLRPCRTFAPASRCKLPPALTLDPLYVDVIIRRYEAVTGAAAVLLETGESFVHVSARRAVEATASLLSAEALAT
jgi:hypothetical protein